MYKWNLKLKTQFYLSLESATGKLLWSFLSDFQCSLKSSIAFSKYRHTCTMLFALSFGRILLLVYSWSSTATYCLLTASLLFSEGRIKAKFCVLPLACRSQLAFWVCSLVIHQRLFFPMLKVPTESQPQSGGMQSSGGAHGLFGGISEWGILYISYVGFMWNHVTQFIGSIIL